MRHFTAAALLVLFCATPLHSAPVQWTEGERVPTGGRANPLEASPEDWEALKIEGRQHTLNYPVTVTGVLIPQELIEKTLVQPKDNWLWKILLSIAKGVVGIRSFDDVERLAGLVPVADDAYNLYALPKPDARGLSQRYGTSFIDTEQGTGISFSCATCHVSSLFGVPVFGLQNRFPRGNEFFIFGKKALSLVEPHTASWAVGASSDSAAMLKRSKQSLASVESVEPAADGLDTSLAHVALSLSHRSDDAYASFSKWHQLFPRDEPLRTLPADSKPGTWWNLKYKNKWLLDGSVRSGNPIFTNILWNEIGRGTDLHELEGWLDTNMGAIDALASAVFAAEPPLYTDFFRADSINLAAAQRGQVLFNSNCVSCHGRYEKNWDQAGSSAWPLAVRLQTSRVIPLADTPVVDVGTDPMRRQGMKSLEQLNRLAISQKHGIKVEAQNGYVPPPLVGIWARWPYFHNNSVPTLCAVLTKAGDRPVTYRAGEAVDPATDFDQDCNGYPSLAKAPAAWSQHPRRLYDTRKPGMSNSGHDEGIFLQNGQEMYSPRDKRDLIEFLKTL